jgi:transposase
MAVSTDGETVVDVPAELAARARVFDTGHGRKTDPTDAHSIVALRTRRLQQLAVDEDLAVLRLLADRRDELSRGRTRTFNRLHRLLAELVLAGAPRHLSVLQAKAPLGTVRPRDPPGGPAWRWPPNSWPSWRLWTASSNSSSGG